MVGVQENLNSRRTVYRFTKQEVDVSDLEIAFAAASNAPCHKQTHPWNYYVLGERSREMLLPSVISLARKKAAQLSDEEIITSEKRAVSKILDIPVIIAVTSKLSPNDSFREEEDYAATVCSLHNMVLSLWDLGIGSQWSTGGITRNALTYRALDISEDEEKIVGFLKVGYPESIPVKVKKTVSEIRKYLP